MHLLINLLSESSHQNVSESYWKCIDFALLLLPCNILTNVVRLLTVKILSHKLYQPASTKAMNPKSQLQQNRTMHAKMTCPMYVGTCSTITGSCCCTALTTITCGCGCCCCCSCCGGADDAAYCGFPYPGWGGCSAGCCPYLYHCPYESGPLAGGYCWSGYGHLDGGWYCWGFVGG